MDCYIVRIYRRDTTDGRAVAGLVETVGLDKKEVFRNPEELWSIIGPKKRRRALKKEVAQARHGTSPCSG